MCPVRCDASYNWGGGYPLGYVFFASYYAVQNSATRGDRDPADRTLWARVFVKPDAVHRLRVVVSNDPPVSRHYLTHFYQVKARTPVFNLHSPDPGGPALCCVLTLQLSPPVVADAVSCNPRLTEVRMKRDVTQPTLSIHTGKLQKMLINRN